MNHESSLMRSYGRSRSQLVDEACRHWEARRQLDLAQRDLGSQKPKPFTIALARELGTDGTLVAQEVGKLLGWHVYDHELLENIAQEMGLRTALLASVDERKQSWVVEMVQGFTTGFEKSDRGATVSESAYVQHLVQTVLTLGIHGECVIVGRGAAFILPAETTLRVRLVGPVQERIAALSHNLGISELEATRRVQTIDRERTEFVQNRFQKDPTDPRNYDLILNALRLSVTQRAEVIVETLHRLHAHQIERADRIRGVTR